MGSQSRQIEANRINMNKLKTKKAALKLVLKRFKMTKKGEMKRNGSYGNHGLTKKDKGKDEGKNEGRKRKYKEAVMGSNGEPIEAN